MHKQNIPDAMLERVVLGLARGLSDARFRLRTWLTIGLSISLILGIAMLSLAASYYDRFPNDLWLKFYLEDTGLKSKNSLKKGGSLEN